ncbi:THO complex subunit 7 [Leptinotarsa decemlineata]|uniref:THO complex subunit 7 n=1 Tax=Leptinotarsa decemlineata TaxID=7539 RepID=UPI000C252B5D|nr:THO complex subunit 7 homolog [Leptinotarsa decemlineata]
MTDEEVIKRRLIFDGDGTGDDRRFNLLLKMIAKWVNTTDESPEENKQTYDKILVQLSIIEHSRRRSELVTKSNDEQLIKYQNLHAEYEKKIADIKEEITAQRLELEKAKTIKQNRIQYDLLARDIAAEPPRKEMNNQLVQLQKQLKELGEEKRRLVQKLDNRKKQFHVLSTSANQLQALLDEDEAKGETEMNTSLDDVNTNSPEPMSE